MIDERKPKRLTRLDRTLRTAGLALAFSLIAAFGAWLLWTAACLYDQAAPLCRHQVGGWLVLIGTLAICWLWVAWTLRDRLGRRLRRGMYARQVAGLGRGSAFDSVAPLGRVLRQVAHLAIEGDWPEATSWAGGRQHPALYHNRRGWWVEVAVEGGTWVWVGQQVMYEWLLDVKGRKWNVKPGESAIGARYWEPLIGRLQWDARCKLLQAVGAAACTTSSPASRRLERDDVVGIMEDLEEQAAISWN